MLLEDVSLSEGQRLRQSEFDQYFGAGATGKGIEIRYDDKGQKYLWLFAKEGGRYDDDIGSDRFAFVGEDPQGPGVDDPGNEDQELVRGNAALRDAIEAPIPIFLFFQPEETKLWEFRGIVEVVDYESESLGGRRVYTFTLEPLDSSDPVIEGSDGTSQSEALGEERVPDITTPNRSEVTRNRIIRNSRVVRNLKESYEHRCQVCGDRRERRDQGYAEGHHLRPLGKPHIGPDQSKNVLILCPNHHADFDNGMVRVDPDTLELSHAYEDELDGTKLELAPGHDIDSRFIRYHNQGLAKF